MSGEDRLPVLTFPAPRPVQPKAQTDDPDDLARAIAALREAESYGRSSPSDRASHTRKPETDRGWQEDSFSPIGHPKPRPKAQPKPQRRAGPPEASDDDTPHAPGQITTQAPPDGGPDTARTPLTRRILSLYLPNFAMERWQRDAARRGEALPEDLPQALATEGRHGPVIHAVNRAAALAGVQTGARVVDMRALVPTLKVDYADTGADRAALGRLMLWARRWCPWTALDGLGGDGSAGLMMDTTGSDHLWGGEAALLRDIEGRLAGIGLTSRLAIAPTQGAAWALARLGGVREVCTGEGLELRMAPMPVRALRLDADTVLLLKRLGLKTVGEVAAVPRLSLARRFSRAALPANPLLRLDQMMGRLGEPVSAPDDPPRFAVQSALAEPVQDPTAHLPGLCAELCAAMAGAGFGARRISLTVYRSDGEVSSVEAATSQASRDPGHLARLFEGKLERIDPGFGFDLITLSATVAERITVTQTRLDGAAEAGPDLARLIDRLSARFGAGTLRRPALRESHMPERREVWAPAMAGTPRPPEPGAQPRPGRLLEPAEEVHVIYAVPEGPPAQFVWRKQTHRVTRFAGPERIAPEWWADRPGTRLRDYYRVEDQYGRRFWIFREGVQEDGRGGVPRWCVHGVFA
jgi:protein ImuB